MTDVPAHITGTVWKIQKRPGDAVAEGETIVILESMKMELPVESPSAGTIKEIRCNEGQPVAEGDVLAVLEP
jgi:acetyl-CoA carboxylase biotin carboxyl carrier protein